jgi:hypothetical protein
VGGDVGENLEDAIDFPLACDIYHRFREKRILKRRDTPHAKGKSIAPKS